MAPIRLLFRTHKWLERTPMLARELVVVALAVAIAWADIATPAYVLLAGFYLLPIFLAIWFCRSITAFAVIVLSAGVSVYMTAETIPTRTPWWHSLLAFVSVGLVFMTACMLMIYLKLLVRRLELENRTDSLTGLRNRRAFWEMASIELLRAQRSEEPLTLALLDLDNFKQVNDKQGHSVGDALLVAASHSMIASVRDIDLVARIGGDEFALLFPRTDADNAMRVLTRLHSSLITQLHTFSPTVGATTGAVCLRGGVVLSLEELIEHADRVMYSIKHQSKNRVRVEAVGSDQDRGDTAQGSHNDCSRSDRL